MLLRRTYYLQIGVVSCGFAPQTVYFLSSILLWQKNRKTMEEVMKLCSSIVSHTAQQASINEANYESLSGKRSIALSA